MGRALTAHLDHYQYHAIVRVIRVVKPAPKSPAERCRRLLAAGCAALVFALTMFAASPAAHDWLHAGDDQAAREHGCAIVLFASGVALPVGPIDVPLPAETPQVVSPATAAEVYLVSPRYLRQPERGPPADRLS